MENWAEEKFKKIVGFINKYLLLVFYITSLIYMELIYKLNTLKNIKYFLFPILFAIIAGAFLYLISSLFSTKINRIVSYILTSVTVTIFSIQLVYYSIFKTPLSFYSIVGAKDALQFGDIIKSAILGNFAAIILLILPIIVLIFINAKISFEPIGKAGIRSSLLFIAASYSVFILSLGFTGTNNLSPFSLYFQTFSSKLSISRLGLMTTMQLDLKESLTNAGKGVLHTPLQAKIIDSKDKLSDDSISAFSERKNGHVRQVVYEKAKIDNNIDSAIDQTEKEPPVIEYNIMDINWESLIEHSNDSELTDMHGYFSKLTPTEKNEYSGLFKDNNLILITAESFSPYIIDKELTPTLYKMSTNGFVFNNFYNPVWEVSTSDGEYVACTGLIPKSGIWSMAKSGQNHLPYTMGNQLRSLGYLTKAYHNHTYTYYDRHLSHPNMGYDYKGLGNGLNVEETWPESDLEMINVTVDEYIDKQPFHTYYMTVSGHMNYNFYGNYISVKNKPYVEHLPYSEPCRAYLACNLELEFAMDELIKQLEAADALDNTVIVISADHYPYGLEKEYIDELAGHQVEDNFELYKSTLILWKNNMEPIIIDKPCSSLDIIPTLSNLFGLSYDSRLLTGKDILSNSPPLVIFDNRSWITDRAMYNAITDSVTFTDGTETDRDYVNTIHQAVANKFFYSAKILEKDYYAKVTP